MRLPRKTAARPPPWGSGEAGPKFEAVARPVVRPVDGPVEGPADHRAGSVWCAPADHRAGSVWCAPADRRAGSVGSAPAGHRAGSVSGAPVDPSGVVTPHMDRLFAGTQADRSARRTGRGRHLKAIEVLEP